MSQAAPSSQVSANWSLCSVQHVVAMVEDLVRASTSNTKLSKTTSWKTIEGVARIVDAGQSLPCVQC